MWKLNQSVEKSSKMYIIFSVVCINGLMIDNAKFMWLSQFYSEFYSKGTFREILCLFPSLVYEEWHK